MEILLTNDDGIFAPGLAAIYKQLVKIGNVTVVAPADSRSGTSHSITFFKPLACNKVNIDGLFTGHSVHGSPADCVKIAALEFCEKPIDLIVAGINNGANAGINAYYSGTVAAAMEGAFLKIPSVALSVAAKEDIDFDKAAEHCLKIIKKLLPIQNGEVINVNIPNLPDSELKGIRIVPQSTEQFHEHYVRQKNEQGQTVFQLAGGLHRDEQHPTDTNSLADGYITITAFTIGMTNHEKTNRLKEIADWQL